MELISQAFWAFAPSLTVGVVLAYWKRGLRVKEEQELQEHRERIKAETLKLSLLVASAQLSYAIAMAMKRGATNGEVEPAVKRYDSAMEAFRNYEQEQLARNTIDS